MIRTKSENDEGMSSSETKKNRPIGGCGGSCVFRTTSIHAGYSGIFGLYPHPYQHKAMSTLSRCNLRVTCRNDRRSIPPPRPRWPAMPPDRPVAASGAAALLAHVTAPLDPAPRLSYACTGIGCGTSRPGGVGPHGLDEKGFGVVARILRIIFQES